MRNVYKWRLSSIKNIYISDEKGIEGEPFIINKQTNERITKNGVTKDVSGIDDGAIADAVGKVIDIEQYTTMFNNMLTLAKKDSDGQKIMFLEVSQYFNLDNDDCVQEALKPRCEGYEPVFQFRAYTLENDTEEVEYNVFGERIESDKTMRYTFNLGIPRGKQGEKGDDGAGCKGDKGDDGKNLIVTPSAEIVAIEPNETPRVQINTSDIVEDENNNLTQNWNFKFEIPRGERGEVGANGEQGEAGKAATINSLTTSVGTIYDGDNGEDITDKINKSKLKLNVSSTLTKINPKETTDNRNLYDIELKVDAIRGPRGEQGAQGEWAKLEIDSNRTTIEMLNPEQEPFVNIGIAEDADVDNKQIIWFNFGIPQGRTGLRGEDGTGGGEGGSGVNFATGSIYYIQDSKKEEVGIFDWDRNEDGEDVLNAHLYNWPSGGDSNVSKSALEIVANTHNVLTYKPTNSTHQTLNLMAKNGISLEVSGSTITFIGNGNGGGGTIEGEGHIYTEALDSLAEGTDVNRGKENEANGRRSHAEGRGTMANGISSHSEGGETQAIEINCHSEGYKTIARGGSSHSEGGHTEASGTYSHAEGESSQTGASFKNKEGVTKWIGGTSSHAEGYRTKAIGDYCHTEGYMTIAGSIEDNDTNPLVEKDVTGHYSHAGGYCAKAIGNGSFSHGFYTEVKHSYETTFGKYNQSNEDTLFSIGVGNGEDTRKNAIEIYNDGTMFVKNIGNYDGTNPGDVYENKPSLSIQDAINTREYFDGEIRIANSVLNVSPNKYSVYKVYSSVTVVLKDEERYKLAGLVAEYCFVLKPDGVNYELKFNDENIIWKDGFAPPLILEDKHSYEFSIIDNRGLWAEFY